MTSSHTPFFPNLVFILPHLLSHDKSVCKSYGPESLINPQPRVGTHHVYAPAICRPLCVYVVFSFSPPKDYRSADKGPPPTTLSRGGTCTSHRSPAPQELLHSPAKFGRNNHTPRLSFSPPIFGSLTPKSPDPDSIFFLIHFPQRNLPSSLLHPCLAPLLLFVLSFLILSAGSSSRIRFLNTSFFH